MVEDGEKAIEQKLEWLICRACCNVLKERLSLCTLRFAFLSSDHIALVCGRFFYSFKETQSSSTIILLLSWTYAYSRMLFPLLAKGNALTFCTEIRFCLLASRIHLLNAVPFLLKEKKISFCALIIEFLIRKVINFTRLNFTETFLVSAYYSWIPFLSRFQITFSFGLSARPEEYIRLLYATNRNELPGMRWDFLFFSCVFFLVARPRRLESKPNRERWRSDGESAGCSSFCHLWE